MNHPGSSINRNATILVLSDDIEVRDGAEALLLTDGYRVSPARNEQDAVESAMRVRPDIILVSLDRPVEGVAACARRVRLGARLGDGIPVLMFCIATVEEGAEIAIGENIFATWPADFNQLRELMIRFLDNHWPDTGA